MKKTIFIAFINIIVLGCLNAQSSTIEITPDFFIANDVFQTEKIQHNNTDEILEFIGLSCYHKEEGEVNISFRIKTGNKWSTWLPLNKQHEFVASDRAAYQAKPIKESFSTIQFRTSRKLNNPLNIRFFLATENKKQKDHLLEPTITRSVNCELPEVCERICWCPTCPIDLTPQLTDPTHLIVHHSAGNNESNDFSQVVESIWDLHVNTNGWDDIGYNWLIDPNGVLYQGRPDNYQGAHFSCINENTVGICVIGDYSLVAPEEAAINTLVNILAHEATEHLIDVNIQTQHLTGEFLLDNIAGHRDSSGSLNACSGTVCPGDSFYPLLPEIRLRVSDLPCYLDVISSIDKSSLENMNVYPNPFDDYLFIESDLERTLEVVDIHGRSWGFVISGKQNNVSRVEAGVYFLLDNGQVVEKIVKK